MSKTKEKLLSFKEKISATLLLTALIFMVVFYAKQLIDQHQIVKLQKKDLHFSIELHELQLRLTKMKYAKEGDL